MPFRILSIDEASVYLHVVKREVEHWVRAGEIPHEMRGGRPVFRRVDLDAWASQHILSLPWRRLQEYHAASTEGTRSHVEEEALMPILIQPEYIRTGLLARTRRSLIEEMTNLAETTDRVNDVQELLESVLQREDLCPTALSGGMALLHCRHLDPYRFEGSFLVFGSTVKPLPFSAPDGRPTRYFFLLCSQEESLHLHMLARLCLMAQGTDMLERFWNCENSEAFYEAIVESELAALEGRRSLRKETEDSEPPEEAGAI